MQDLCCLFYVTVWKIKYHFLLIKTTQHLEAGIKLLFSWWHHLIKPIVFEKKMKFYKIPLALHVSNPCFPMSIMCYIYYSVRKMFYLYILIHGLIYAIMYVYIHAFECSGHQCIFIWLNLCTFRLHIINQNELKTFIKTCSYP